jgi:hypothetical protein
MFGESFFASPLRMQDLGKLQNFRLDSGIRRTTIMVIENASLLAMQSFAPWLIVV